MGLCRWGFAPREEVAQPEMELLHYAVIISIISIAIIITIIITHSIFITVLRLLFIITIVILLVVVVDTSSISVAAQPVRRPVF